MVGVIRLLRGARLLVDGECKTEVAASEGTSRKFATADRFSRDYRWKLQSQVQVDGRAAI